MQGKDGAGGGGGENGSEICMQERSGAEEDEEGGGSGGGRGRARKEGVRKRGAMFIERLLPAPSLPSLSAFAP